MSNIKTYSKKKNGSTKLTSNFRVREFACNDGSDTIKIDLDNVKNLQQIRNHFGKAVNINSGYRTVAYNKKVGGVSNSYHTKGQAADIVISGVNARKVAMYAENISCHGVIWYPVKKFTHVDTRSGTFHAICIGSTYYSEPTVTLKKGAKSSNVKWLQYMLNELGYALAVDGSFGSATETAVREFQKKYGLTVDGLFGIKSRTKLKEVLM